MSTAPRRALFARRCYARATRWARRHVRLCALSGYMCLGLFVGFASSCGTTERVAIRPPQIAGASFMGSTMCTACHWEQAEDFDTSTHARLGHAGHAEGLACEACHGPASNHLMAGGGIGNIVRGDDPETCFSCHLDKRAEFSLPHSHPVIAGVVGCIDCHDPHGGDAVLMTTRGVTNYDQVCLECHDAQAGPFTFAHDAMREGCTLCHQPHGSVNAKMLVARNGNLCLQCHFLEPEATNLRMGSFNHAGGRFAAQGTCWTAGCHEAVHGSHVSPKLRF